MEHAGNRSPDLFGGDTQGSPYRTIPPHFILRTGVIGLVGGDTNLYAYVGGDPINATDPTGLMLQGNPAMDSALNGGFLAWLGFEQFARGAYNFNEGRLKLSNERTFNEGIAQMRKGICQMVAGGNQVVQAGYTAVAAVAVVGAVAKVGVSDFPRSSLRGVSEKWLRRNKPRGWRQVPSDNGKGWKWVDPKNIERLRFTRANGLNPAASQFSRQANGYFVWRDAAGNLLDVDGNVVPSSDPLYKWLTHIIYEGL